MVKKAVAKRIRITKTGKILRRPMAVGHFRAKRRGAETRQKRRLLQLSPVDRRSFIRY